MGQTGKASQTVGAAGAAAGLVCLTSGGVALSGRLFRIPLGWTQIA